MRRRRIDDEKTSPRDLSRGLNARLHTVGGRRTKKSGDSPTEAKPAGSAIDADADDTSI
jgi:hypothetical protein